MLSLPLFDAIADKAPGLIKVALRPPVSVEAVATTCVAKAAQLESCSTGSLSRTVPQRIQAPLHWYRVAARQQLELLCEVCACRSIDMQN